jgi:hypothetical protein
MEERMMRPGEMGGMHVAEADTGCADAVGHHFFASAFCA